MSDPDLERLLREALAAPARPMTETQIAEVAAHAAARLRPVAQFPGWAIAASAVCLGGLVLLAFSASGEGWLRILALAAGAGNLALSPLAALVLVRHRRSCHAD